MNMQYEIEFEEGIDFDKIYIDQSIFITDVADRRISSAYTAYGIQCIDSQYGHLIRNMQSKVKQLYKIDRRKPKYCDIKTRKEYEMYSYHTYYDPIELDYRCGDVRVEWENGHVVDFHYGDQPVFDIRTRKTNPDQLRKEILDNPHLHIMIKENLLSNINSVEQDGLF